MDKKGAIRKMRLLEYNWNPLRDMYHFTFDAGIHPSGSSITIMAKGSGGTGEVNIKKVVFFPVLSESVYREESERIKHSPEVLRQIKDIRNQLTTESKQNRYFVIDDVHIVRATIDYTRKVVATGTNLKEIKEERVELHDFFLLLFHHDLNLSIAAQMKTKIVEKGFYDYSLQILKNDFEKIEDLLYPGWKRDVKNQIKLHIEKKQNLHLPILLH